MVEGGNKLQSLAVWGKKPVVREGRRGGDKGKGRGQ